MATNNTSKAGKAAEGTSAPTESTPRTETATTDTGKTQNSGTYQVKDGDSLESVAAELGMEREELVALNPEIAAEGRGSNFLYTGQELRTK